MSDPKMKEVVATTRGYYGGEIKEYGDRFMIPDADWRDEKRRPSWVRGVRKEDDEPEPEVFDPVDPVRGAALPDPSPSPEPKGKDALVKKPAAAAAAKTEKVEPFSDAPAPEKVRKDNGVKSELGVEPDWLPPSAGKDI